MHSSNHCVLDWCRELPPFFGKNVVLRLKYTVTSLLFATEIALDSLAIGELTSGQQGVQMDPDQVGIVLQGISVNTTVVKI